jgi:hypothetical protein
MIVVPLSNISLWRANRDQKARTVVALGISLRHVRLWAEIDMVDSCVAIKKKFGLKGTFLLTTVNLLAQ